MNSGRVFWAFVVTCTVALVVIVGQSYLTYREVVRVDAPNPVAAMPASHMALLAAEMSQTSTGPAPVPLDFPRYTTIGQAAQLLGSADPVYLIENESGGTIFPVASLERYEVVNTTIEGRPATISYCSASRSAVAYWDTVAGLTTSFEPTRMYIDGNLVMRDRATGTAWSQLLGIAMQGHLAGLSLQRIHVYPTTWERARVNYPEAVVLTSGLTSDFPLPVAAPPQPARHFLPFGNDDRLKATDTVVAVVAGSQAAAVTRDAVLLRHVVPLEAGGKHLVALADGKLGAVRVFDRDLDGSTVMLDAVGGMVLDRTTRSVWDEHGRCVSGPLKGLHLRAVVSVDCLWSAWNGFFPDTAVFK